MATKTEDEVTPSTAGASLRGASSAEDRKRAAELMGSVRSQAKTDAARLNGNKPKVKFGDKKPGRPRKPLEASPCTCGVGMALDGHRWNCPRGQVIKRRREEGTL